MLRSVVFISLWLFAQEQEVETYQIGAVRVEGAGYLKPEAILSASGLYAGKTLRIPGDDLAEVTRKMWAQDIFSDIEILADSFSKGKVYLVLRVVERPRIARYEFRGVTRSEAKELGEKTKLVKGTLFTESKKRAALRVIKNFFQGKGYFQTQAEVETQPDSVMQNGVRVIFRVRKGPRVKVQSINFTGSTFRASKLRAKLKQTKQVQIWRIWKRSKFIRGAFEEDKEKLIQYLQNQGYRDATVLKDTIYFISPRRLKVDITLYEGKKYYYRYVHWEGNTLHDSTTLNKILGIRKGQRYNPQYFQKRLQMDPNGNDVASLYLDDGYLFFRAEPQEVLVGEDSIDLYIRIFEGPQATINRIFIEGNTKTRDKVILRELRSLPGDKFNRSAIIRTQRELLALGYFDQEKMNITPLPDVGTGTVDIKYTVQERPSDQVFLQGGWGGAVRDVYGNPLGGGLILSMGLRFNNFAFGRILDKKSWKPLPTGDGQQLGLQIQLNGRGFQNYSINFLDPWFGGRKPNSLGASAYYSVQRGLFSDYYLSILGVSVDLGRRLRFPDDFFRSYTTFSYRYYTARNAGTLLGGTGNAFVNIISVRQAFDRTSMDAPIYPRSGSSVTFSVEATPPWSLFYPGYQRERDFLRLLEFHKWKWDAQGFVRIVGNMVLNPRMRIGFLGRYNARQSTSPFERFFLGGDGIQGFNIDGREIIALRGYAAPYIGPINGAVAFIKYTLELRQAITLQPMSTLWVHVFAEAGNAWGNLKDFNPFVIRRSFGVGARIFLPMFGLLGVDYGYGIDDARDPNGLPLGGGRFHFMIGQQF
ncbi:MAG: outer membrane protein assembly factor BamA [Bacteroidia bacterium]